MPCIIDWAASLDDPFGLNSHDYISLAVKENWDHVWPELVDRHDDPAIQAVVCLPTVSGRLLHYFRLLWPSETGGASWERMASKLLLNYGTRTHSLSTSKTSFLLIFLC